MCISRNTEARSPNHSCRGKAIMLHILSVCLYSCCIYLAYEVHVQDYIIICGLSGSAVFDFCHLINGTSFGYKFIEYKACVLIFVIS